MQRQRFTLVSHWFHWDHPKGASLIMDAQVPHGFSSVRDVKAEAAQVSTVGSSEGNITKI